MNNFIFVLRGFILFTMTYVMLCPLNIVVIVMVIVIVVIVVVMVIVIVVIVNTKVKANFTDD